MSFEWREGRTSDVCGLSRLLIKLDRSKEVETSKNGIATGNLKCYRTDWLIPIWDEPLQVLLPQFQVTPLSVLPRHWTLHVSSCVPDCHLLMCFLNYSGWFHKSVKTAYSTDFLVSLPLRSHRSEGAVRSERSRREWWQKWSEAFKSSLCGKILLRLMYAWAKTDNICNVLKMKDPGVLGITKCDVKE